MGDKGIMFTTGMLGMSYQLSVHVGFCNDGGRSQNQSQQEGMSQKISSERRNRYLIATLTKIIVPISF